MILNLLELRLLQPLKNKCLIEAAKTSGVARGDPLTMSVTWKITEDNQKTELFS